MNYILFIANALFIHNLKLKEHSTDYILDMCEKHEDTAPVEFTPYKSKVRKPGTGCVTMINDHLYEGWCTPADAYGKRESYNIYAKTREECEEKLA